MCHQNSRPCVHAEEAVAVEECLLIYCKPVEFYNILHRRAQSNPSFLCRSLTYRLEAEAKTGPIDKNVIFSYRDQTKLLRRTEVTKHFSCPFCLVRCGSFKGLRCHLRTSHDLFDFEFWSSEEYRAVNVSVRTDTLCLEAPETVADETGSYWKPYRHCSKIRKRKKPENPLDKGKCVFPHALESAVPELAAKRLCEGFLKSLEDERGLGSYPTSRELHNSRMIGHPFCSYEIRISNGTACVAADNNQGGPVARAQSVEDIDRSVPALQPSHAKSRKLTSERTDSRSSTLLQKRLFYHSHRAQPMALEQVMSDRDSEDEDDDVITGLEDRRLLDDFVDVTGDEKHLMHLWNSFVRKQRVLADGHVPWACEAFVRLHGKLFVESSPLFWCWRLFSIKLWNHGLLDASTMNTCSKIIQNYQDEISAVERAQIPVIPSLED